jgi:hypothetical protein
MDWATFLAIFFTIASGHPASTSNEYGQRSFGVVAQWFSNLHGTSETEDLRSNFTRASGFMETMAMQIFKVKSNIFLYF